MVVNGLGERGPEGTEVDCACRVGLSLVFSSKKAINSPVLLGTLTGEATRSAGSVVARK